VAEERVQKREKFLRGTAEMSTTDMFTFSASRLMCLPTVIHPHQRIPCEITKTVPDNQELGPRLRKNNVKFPLILSSDMTLDDSE